MVEHSNQQPRITVQCRLSRLIRAKLLTSMMLQRSAGKPTDEDRAAASAAALCDLCDVYTRSGLSGTWNDLARVYDVRSPASVAASVSA